MSDLPSSTLALYALVLALGVKHGFDADHLAAVDGLTRLNADRRGARWCGTLFSLGHGAIVIAVAVAVAVSRAHWQVPGWLDAAGSLVSIAFLLVLGVANLHAVLTAPPGVMLTPVGLKGRFLGRLLQARHPLAVAAVGALFALSFDTLSQAALFAMVAVPAGGVVQAIALGSVFMLGMLLVDGLNGWWVSRLLSRADALAAQASKVMGLAVGAVSLLAAAWGVARLLRADDGSPTWPTGVAVLLVTFGSYALARRLAARRAPTVSASTALVSA